MQTKKHKLSRTLTPIATALLLAFSSYSATAEKKDDHDHEMEQHGSHEHGVARLTVATTDDGLEISLESPAANVFGFEHKAKSEEEREVVHAAMDKLKDGAALFAINSAAACSLENVDVEASAADGHDDHDHEKEEKHDDHDHDKKEKHDDHDHEKEEKHDDHDHDKKEKHDDHDHEKEEKHDDHDHEKKEKHDDHDHEKEEKHDDHDHEKEEKHDDHDHEKEEKHDDHDHEKEEKHDDHDHEEHGDEESHSDVEATWAFHCEKPAAIETVSVKLFSAFPGGFEEIAVEWITATNAGKTELKADGEVSLKL